MKSVLRSIFQILKLIRYLNLAIVAITQLLVARFLVAGTSIYGLLTNTMFDLMVASTLLIASAGYIINDYYDIKIDYVNKPNRVVVGKHLKRRHVLVMHSFFNGLGILLGVFVSWWVTLVNILASFLLWIYSNQLKRLPLWGNLVVSLLTGLSVFVVYVLFQQNLELIAMYAIFAFFISLIREIVKDMEDIEGDEKFGCKTLPISIGMPATKRIIYFITFLFLIVVFLLANPLSIFWPFFGTLTIILAFLCNRIYVADKKNDYANISTYAKVIMVIGILSMTIIQ
ncbi:MAG: geranylgeranylglycerol-phosphate geranylgeranyltransferase [Cyclobacteriaceae bacterium]|nr:geranylgeranylglycerol-phosphate geranylgeranyltransferase [Cyclobacteriaceae bacterium]